MTMLKTNILSTEIASVESQEKKEWRKYPSPLWYPTPLILFYDSVFWLKTPRIFLNADPHKIECRARAEKTTKYDQSPGQNITLPVFFSQIFSVAQKNLVK